MAEGHTDVYWVIDEESFMDALNRVHGGEHPDIVYAECFANALINPPEDYTP